MTNYWNCCSDNYQQLIVDDNLDITKIFKNSMFNYLPVAGFSVFSCKCSKFLVHFSVKMLPQEKWPKTKQCIHLCWMANTKLLAFWKIIWKIYLIINFKLKHLLTITLTIPYDQNCQYKLMPHINHMTDEKCMAVKLPMQH